MVAVDGLRPAIVEISAIDHHAHLLAHPDAPDRPSPDVLTESGDSAQIEAVLELPTYRRGPPRPRRGARESKSPKEALATAPAAANFPAHVKSRSCDQCHLEAMFVDDGFRVAGDHLARRPRFARRVPGPTGQCASRPRRKQ